MSARKSPEDRANREKPVYPDMTICWDGKIRGPQLPGGYKWCRRTRAWWEMIRSSAQAMSFHQTDWEVLLETARLHNLYWDPESSVRPTEMTGLAGEIRRRVEPYGFTWADRRKYGISITNGDEVANEAEQIAKNASKSVNYRKKLDGLT